MTLYIRTWVGRCLIVTLILLALLYSLTPLLVRELVINWLERQGLTAEFEYLELSPGIGRVVVHGLRGQNSQGRGFALEALTLDLALWPLQERQLVIEKAEVQGGRLDLYRRHDSWEVAGLDLARLAVDDNTDVESQQTAPASSTSPWQLELQAFSLSDIQVCLQQPASETATAFYQCVGLDTFVLEGGARALFSDAPEATLPQRLKLARFHIDDLSHERQSFGFEGMSLRQLDWGSEGLTFGELAFHDMRFAERLPEERAHQQHSYHGSLGTLRLEAFSMSESQLSLSRVSLEGLNLLLHRDKTVRFPLLRLIEDLTQPFAPVETTADTQAAPAPRSGPAPVIRIQRLTIGENSRLSWIDEGVSPVAELRLGDLDFSLTDLDSGKPAALSPLSLKAKLGDFGELELAGGVAPLAPKLNLELEGRVKALDLAPLTAYSEAAIAYRITRGQLNQDLKLKVVDDQLDSVVDSRLHKFDIERVNGDTKDSQITEAVEGDSQGRAEAGLLPLDVALNLLREKDDSIRLKLPIQGDIHDPELSFGHIVGVVARKALTEAVISYYTPFGMVSLASMLAESATKLRFEPLIYTPGQTQPNATVRKRLDKLADLLGERRQLALSFCPIANGSDWSVVYGKGQLLEDPASVTGPQKQGLKALAEERGKGLKSLLLQKGVATEQVVVCAGEVNLEGDQPPRVTVSI